MGVCVHRGKLTGLRLGVFHFPVNCDFQDPEWNFPASELAIATALSLTCSRAVAMAGGGHFRDLGGTAHGGIGAAELAATAAAREGAAASEGLGDCLGGENHL